MIKTSNRNNKVLLYLYISFVALLAILVMHYLLINFTVKNYTLLILLSFLTAVAETFLIPLPKVGAISVSFAITFSAILITDPLTATIVTALGILFRFPYVDGKGRVHLFNNPFYKTVFNLSQ